MDQGLEKRWYIRDRVAGQHRQVWLFDHQTATNMGVTNPETGIGTYFKAAPDENIWDCIRRQTSWLDPNVVEGRFYPIARAPGEFYPRIARPIALATKDTLWSPFLTTDKAYAVSARSQLSLLVRKLEAICHIVQPSTKTLDVYGHEIRNLLILAATEVEMHWRGILFANGLSASRFTTGDYFKLAAPMKLLDYAISFHDFPELKPIRPFAGWSAANPTKSLGWYDAYHGVKHNREGEFERGTLRHAFEAVSACIALLVAQFGPATLNFELSSFVGLEIPNWPIEEMYLPNMTSADWMPINYPGL